MATNFMWNMALKDPHLMRLGEYLAQIEGEVGMEEQLEEAFLNEPWMNWFKIIKVVNPELQAKPFICLWSNKDQPHTTCTFFKLCSGGQKKQVS